MNELKTSIKLDSSQAEKAIDKLCQKLDNLTKTADKIAKAYTKQSEAIRKTNDAVVKATTNLHQATVQSDLLTSSFTKSADKLSQVAMKVGELSERFSSLRTPLTFVQTDLENISNKIRRARTSTLKWLDSHSRVKTAVSKISTMYTRTSSELSRITRGVRQWWSNQKMVQSATSSTNRMLDSMYSRIRAIAATYLGIMGTKAVINTSDIMTSAENKLNYTNATSFGDKGYNNDGTYSVQTIQATQSALDKMYASSQKVRVSYTDMMTQVSKNMALAGDAFQNNTDNAIRFQEIMAEAYAIGGASAAEMSSSMYQLTQALGAGVLAGDELRSVREGAPLAYKAIEEFAQGVYNTTDSLKEMGSEGLITSEMVVAAIMNSGDEMDRAFAQTVQTFDQTLKQIVSAAQYAFIPVSKMLRTMLNDAIDNGLISKVESFMVVISKMVQIIVKSVSIAANWIVENWSWVQDILVAGLTTWLILLTTAAIKSAKSFLKTNWAILLVATAIFAVIYALMQLQQGTINTTQVILVALGVITAGIMILAVVFHSMILFWIGLAVAFLAFIFNFFEEICGGAAFAVSIIADIVLLLWNIIKMVINLIIGIVYMCGATVYNTTLGFIEGMIQIIASIVDPIAGIIEWFVNAWNGAFTSVSGAFANFCGQLLSGLIGLVKPFAKLLDKAFGWDVNGMIESAQSTMKGWGKTSAAVTYSVAKTPTFDRIRATKAFSNGTSTLGYSDPINPFDAFDSGYNFGSGVKSNINNWGSNLINSLGSKIGKGINLDEVGKALGLNFSGLSGIANNNPNGYVPVSDLNRGGSVGSGFPNSSNPYYSVGGSYKQPSIDELVGDTADIKGNTSKIADSMELTEDDLSFLRKAAELEWKKEFTTASITVDMSNYNTINGDGDLDGIVTRLTDKLYEELSAVADGVYA